MTKPWGGRFSEGADAAAERFTGSLAFDRRLWPYDITGSAAWARALARAGVITDDECRQIVKGLDDVRGELERGTFPFRVELEDIHMNVERRLIEISGPVAGIVAPRMLHRLEELSQGRVVFGKQARRFVQDRRAEYLEPAAV